MTVLREGEPEQAVGAGYRMLGEIAVAGNTVTPHRERELEHPYRESVWALLARAQ